VIIVLSLLVSDIVFSQPNILFSVGLLRTEFKVLYFFHTAHFIFYTAQILALHISV